ncbi:pilus assembly protein PilW [Acidithiobacillus caldus]|uniref:Pilus assembly protein PilW n=3 Tax=Acidithiobacillus caldus TaxID=33059 RepID=A0A1E7YY15_9PROT|nr:PilW family protein [Acidithiobacillus caldus]MBU2791091.1 pilus assembly protein PilW [Acidithiobacillus caldus]MBU2822018.1 pilus assembly protein PilW [Acidithiobacillus caldus]OFC61427.1 pilus assembly protein PilW [Acidithiobacillus caldus]
MSTQNMGRVGADRLAEAGISLVELLVGLVVTSLLAIAVFSFFLNTSQGISQQNASGEMWQRGRNALALMRQAIESAGYGLPSYSQCPNGVIDSTTNGVGTAGALVAITASTQSSGSGYDPSTTAGINTYAFSTVIGGGAFGGAPTTTVNSQQGVNLQVQSLNNLQPGDLALISLPGTGVCVFGQMTNVAGKGTLNTDCSVTGGGNSQGSSGTVVFNSGKGNSVCFQANPNQIFSQVNPTTGGTLNSAAFQGASLYDLGANQFLFETFAIQENPAGGTPTLVMTQYTGLQATPPTPQPLATGVVDMQLRYGVGSNGQVQNWIRPENYTPSATQQIVAVQLAMLIRSNRYLQNSLSPASFNILGDTYTVPTQNGPGCLQGNCRHYSYHLFQTVVPVRNGIWSTQ